MNRIDSMLQPGEKVLWRLDQRARAGPNWAYLLAGGVPLTVIAVIATTILWHVRVPAGPLVLGGLLMLFPIFFIFLAWVGEWLPRAVAITEHRILLAGSRPSTCKELARAEILRAELFEAFGLVELHLAGGIVRRLKGIENAEGFVRVLEVPGRIWRQRPPPITPFSALLLRYSAYPITLAIVKLAKAGFVSVTGEQPTGAIETTLFILGAFGLCVATAYLLFVTSHRLALRLLPTEEGLRYRCWYLDRRCRGLRAYPAADRPLWMRLEDWFNTGFARKAFGGKVDCDCAPEIIGLDAS